VPLAVPGQVGVLACGRASASIQQSTAAVRSVNLVGMRVVQASGCAACLAHSAGSRLVPAHFFCL
jgi:hypothetical protein